jgi:hypothetical protein
MKVAGRKIFAGEWRRSKRKHSQHLAIRQKKRTVNMDQTELSQLSDEKLVEEFKKIKPSPKFDAFFIGFLVGIILFSVAFSSWGFLTLIPLFLIYLFLKKGKKKA